MKFPSAIALILVFQWLIILASALERSTYIIHMDKSSMPKAFSTHRYWYSSMLNSITTSFPQTSSSAKKLQKPKLIYTYDNAFHGFSAFLSKDELKALKKAPGFVSAFADSIVTADTTHSPEFLSLNTATGLWPASQYGKDVIIGVIDTGIWPESPSFRDGGMTAIPARWKGICQEGEQFNSTLCNRKLIGARYFNQAIRAADPDITIPMNSARDIAGHGTHVASIAAGNYVDGVSFFGYASGTARGVAPRARLAVYKVLWTVGTGSDTLAGIDQAVADGVDIISISLSDRNANLYENPLAIAAFGARERGILVSMSAGNRGPSVRTVRNGIPWSVVVASGTVDRWFAGTLTLGNGVTIIGWTTFPARATFTNLPLVYNETLSACNSNELLTEYAAIVPNGPNQRSIIVCNVTIENSFFDSIMEYLVVSPVAGVIFIADDIEIFRSTTFLYPGTVITPAEAEAVVNYALNRSSSTVEPTTSIDFQQTIIGTRPRAAPALSDFSSRGPGRSYERILKPDIMAPGVLILGAFNPEITNRRIGSNIYLSSDYTLLSGTSMACPHISGVAALLKAAHPQWSPAAIQSAMMTTASPLDNTNQPIREADNTLATPLGIGAGQVDPNRALDPGLIYDASIQDLVNLVCSMNFTREQTQTIVRRSSYNCSTPSSDLNYPSFVATYNSNEVGRTLTRRFRRTVTNVGDIGAATYRFKLVAPINTTVRIQPETLVFQKKYETKSYSLSIRYRGDLDVQHRDGSLSWIDETGKHSVRSVIMVSAGADNFE